MFRGARRRRGLGGGGFPMFLLGFQLLQALTNSNQFFPITFGTIAINILAFVQPRIGHFRWPSVREVCVSTDAALFDGDWKRLVLASFFHLDEWHIYYNMASFMWKSLSLEKDMGSGYFCSLLAVFVLLTNLVYCALHYIATLMFYDYSYLYQCAAGFSGVIFAVKVVTTYRLPPGMSYIMGILPVPSRLAVWAELIVISILIPNASFVGHLAGILVGMAYVMGPLKMIMDSLNGLGSGLPIGRSSPHYTYAARPTGYRAPAQARQVRDEYSDNDPELQEAIHRSLNEDSRTNPPHSRAGPIGFEHLESEARHHGVGRIGFEHLESETRNGDDIGFEHLNREEASSSVRYRPQGSENREMSTEQLRAARIARFERSNY